LRVPFAGLGLHPRAGARIGLDVATTDWHVDHLPSPPSNYVLEGLRGRAAMSAEAAATAEAADDAVATHAVIAELADAVATTDLALNWSGGRDFGYPSNWRAFVLSGSPVWSERLLQRLGPQRLLLTMAAALALAIATVVALQWFLHRRSLRRLMQRLVELDRLQSTQSVDRGGDAETDLAPGDASATIPRDPRDVAFAQRVLAHVREHLELDLSPDALAEHFHVSLRTLQRRLREGLGSAPKDLVLAARLEAAHALLAQGELRVGEVAARVGFDNLSQFSRRFREAYGELPSAVRRQT
jgi:AraC-like DNA-binding protein